MQYRSTTRSSSKLGLKTQFYLFQVNASIYLTYKYLIRHIDEIKADPYLSALVSYALELSDCSLKEEVYNHLLSQATEKGTRSFIIYGLTVANNGGGGWY